MRKFDSSRTPALSTVRLPIDRTPRLREKKNLTEGGCFGLAILPDALPI